MVGVSVGWKVEAKSRIQQAIASLVVGREMQFATGVDTIHGFFEIELRQFVSEICISEYQVVVTGIKSAQA